MATTLQLRRGTTAEAAAFTGAVGELFIDTDNNYAYLHDGVTQGGNRIQPGLVSGTNIKTINNTSLLGSGDITGLATETYVDDALASKQATLVSGSNIKTINNTSLLGSTDIVIDAAAVGLGNVTNESKATMFTSPTFTGTAVLQQTAEVLNSKTSATGTVAHDFSTGAIWYHSSISADFTANFTNVPTTDDRVITVVLVLAQGGTPYIPTAVEINGGAFTINWGGATAPSGTVNSVDVVSFTFIRQSSTFTVLGTLTNYGAV
jgi:hypothetical protein